MRVSFQMPPLKPYCCCTSAGLFDTNNALLKSRKSWHVSPPYKLKTPAPNNTFSICDTMCYRMVIECTIQNWHYIWIVHLRTVVFLRMGYIYFVICNSILYWYIYIYIYIYIYLYTYILIYLYIYLYIYIYIYIIIILYYIIIVGNPS